MVKTYQSKEFVQRRLNPEQMEFTREKMAGDAAGSSAILIVRLARTEEFPENFSIAENVNSMPL